MSSAIPWNKRKTCGYTKRRMLPPASISKTVIPWNSVGNEINKRFIVLTLISVGSSRLSVLDESEDIRTNLIYLFIGSVRLRKHQHK